MAEQMGRIQVEPQGSEQSIGELVAVAMKDFSTLVRKEKELAQAELREAAKGMVPIAAGGSVAMIVGLPAMLMFSVWAALGIAHWIPTMWAFFTMFCFWMLLGAIGGLVAMRGSKRMQPKPERTIRTIKDTAEWARHPTVAPDIELNTVARS